MGTNMREFSVDREVGTHRFQLHRHQHRRHTLKACLRPRKGWHEVWIPGLKNTGPAFTIFSLGFYSS